MWLLFVGGSIMFIFWIACQPPPKPTAPTEEVQESSWPTVSQPDSTDEFQAQELQGFLTDAIFTLQDWRADDVFESYDSVMNWSDGYCPYNSEFDGNALWYGGCQSTSGARYDGYLFRNVYEDYDLFGNGGSWDLDSISGVADIQSSDGTKVHYGGTIYSGEGLSQEGFHTSISVLEGSFLDEHFTESWLGNGPSIHLAQYRVTDPEDQFDSLYINGAVSTDGEGQHIYFSELSAAYYSWDPSCSTNAIGVIGFRSLEGSWAYLFLGSETGPSCDGCGMAYRDINRTQEIGEVCLDIELLLDEGLQSW